MQTVYAWIILISRWVLHDTSVFSSDISSKIKSENEVSCVFFFITFILFVFWYFVNYSWHMKRYERGRDLRSRIYNLSC